MEDKTFSNTEKDTEYSTSCTEMTVFQLHMHARSYTIHLSVTHTHSHTHTLYNMSLPMHLLSNTPEFWFCPRSAGSFLTCTSLRSVMGYTQMDKHLQHRNHKETYGWSSIIPGVVRIWKSSGGLLQEAVIL